MTNLPIRQLTCAALILSFAVAGPLFARPASASVRSPQMFIIWCDCATPAKQARVQRRIERAGGKIVYAYGNMSGFAVSARLPADGSTLKRKLERIEGINSVQPDGAVSLARPTAMIGSSRR